LFRRLNLVSVDTADLIWHGFPLEVVIPLEEIDLLVATRNVFACEIDSRTGLGS